jgi:uncharacterized GH25 family protein
MNFDTARRAVASWLERFCASGAAEISPVVRWRNSAPTGRNSIAQCSALGNAPTIASPEGASCRVFRPDRACRQIFLCPSALRWAIEFRSFRAKPHFLLLGSLVIAVLTLPLLFSSAFAQDKPTEPPPKPKGSIKGKVMSDDGQPLAGANVNLNAAGNDGMGGWRQIQTDDEGNFVADGLAPASYNVHAGAYAYVMAQQPLEQKYHRLGDVVNFTLVKGGVITGRITNALGEPVIAAAIRVEKVADSEGRKTPGDAWYGMQRKTDDRGIYRVYGLPAGRYIISVGGKGPYRSGPQMSYESDVPTYHPASSREGATEVRVSEGEEVRGIDIRYRSEKGHSISGRVSGAPSDNSITRGGIQVELSHYPSHAIAMTSFVQATDANKAFEFFTVPDGEYELRASASGDWQDENRDRYLSPRKRLTVKGGNVTGVELRLLALAAVQGKVEWELTPEKDRKPECQPTRAAFPEETIITLKPDNPNSDSNFFGAWSVPNDKREVKFRGLESGTYRFTANLPDETWYIKSITQKSDEPKSKIQNPKSPSPVDIGKQGVNLKPGENRADVILTIADGAVSVTGRVTPDKNQAVPARLRVYLIPAEKEAADDVLRYAEQKTKDGSFTFPNLAPGKYWLLARKVPDDEADQKRVNPTAWDITTRKTLRAEAEAVNQAIELKSCQRAKDFSLKFGAAVK